MCLCILVAAGYLAAGVYRWLVTPNPYLGVTAKYSPATESFQIVYVEPSSPASEVGLVKDESIVAIDGRPPRFGFFWLALTATARESVELDVMSARNEGPRSVSVTLPFPPLRGALSVLAFGSLLCGVVFLVLHYRYPAPPERTGKTIGWFVVAAILPLFLALVLALISLFTNMPLWVFLLLGFPACLAPLFFVRALGTGFDSEAPAWRNTLVGAGMLFPLPFLIAIHLTHAPPKGTDQRDLVTDLGTDYLEALVMLLLLGSLFVALCWFFRSKRGYKMLPFLNAADVEFNGQAVAEELAAELQRIDDAHRVLRDRYRRYVMMVDDERPRDSSRLRDLAKHSGKRSRERPSRVSEISTTPSSNVPAKQAGLGDIATFKVGDNSFSLGQFFSDLKAFWSATDPKGIFSGSIRRHGDKVRMIVSFRDDERFKVWSVDRAVEPKNHGAEFAKLLREFAFRIYPDIEENSVCATQDALQEYTEAVFHMAKYFDNQDPRSACEALEKAMDGCRKAQEAEDRDEGISPLLPILLASSCLALGKMREAEEFSNIAIRMVPEAAQDTESETAAAWWLRGVADYKQGNYLAAEKSFRIALNADGKFENALSHRVSLMIDMGQRKGSQRKTLVDTIDELATCRRERLKKKTLRERRSEVERSRNRGLRKAVILGDLFLDFRLEDEAEKQYRRVVKQHRSDAWACIRLAGLLAGKPGAQKEALSILRPLRKKLASRYKRLRLKAQAKVGRFRKFFRDEATLERKLADTGSALGYIHFNLGRIRLDKNGLWSAKAAVSEFLKATQIEPVLSEAYSGLAWALYALKRYKETGHAIQLALHLGENNPEIHNLMGDIYEREGEIEKAVGEFRQAVERAPSWTEPHCSLGYLYRNAGDLTRALEEFKTAQRLNPMEIYAFHGAGSVLRHMNRSNEAAEQYQNAIRIDGQDAYAQIELATCYQSLGKSELAARHKKVALDLGDSLVEGEYNRSCFWALAGERERALEFLSKAISSTDTTKEQAAIDIDLVSLHGDPEFEALVQKPSESISPKLSTAASGKTA
jgi:tetratricopeptide (TPR) repeat protein